MRKTWIKKENLYPKPFYKQKLKMALIGVVIMGVIFFTYQIFYINQLQLSTSHLQHYKYTTPHESSSSDSELTGNEQRHFIELTKNPTIRGVHYRNIEKYKPIDGMFVCHKSQHKIPFDRLNDDYCDCPDGSDEPSTNACPNGIFYCSHQLRRGINRHPISIPNSRINDGICDCCDGSDEWMDDANTGHIKCPNVCL